MTMTKSSGNLFTDLGFPDEEAQNLSLRSQAMQAVEVWYRASGLTQARAALVLGIKQPRFNQLLKGKIGDFSLDALVNMAASAGLRVGLTIKPVALPRSVKRPTPQKMCTPRENGLSRLA